MRLECSTLGEETMKDNVVTHSVAVNIGAANESETGVNKILVHKQKEKVESMKAILLTVAQLKTAVCTVTMKNISNRLSEENSYFCALLV